MYKDKVLNIKVHRDGFDHPAKLFIGFFCDHKFPNKSYNLSKGFNLTATISVLYYGDLEHYNNDYAQSEQKFNELYDEEFEDIIGEAMSKMQAS